MLYDLRLRDLGLANTRVGVALRLHECRDVTVAIKVTDSTSFMNHMLFAKVVGYQMIAAGCVKSIVAVPMPDMADIMATLDGQELARNDPLYLVANDVDLFIEVRETIRSTLARGYAYLTAETRYGIGFFSLWLALHDPLFANAVRQTFLDTLRQYRCAIMTIGCTEHQCYASKIGCDVADLSKALAVAATTDRSCLIRA